MKYGPGQRTAKQVRTEAEAALTKFGAYRIIVRIGICNWTFTCKRVVVDRNPRYVLRKGENVLVDFRNTSGEIITDLLGEIQYHM